MGIGVCVFMVTLGAIFRFAIDDDLVSKSVDLHVIGVILMIAGGAVFALLFLQAMKAKPGERDELYDGEGPPYSR